MVTNHRIFVCQILLAQQFQIRVFDLLLSIKVHVHAAVEEPALGQIVSTALSLDLFNLFLLEISNGTNDLFIS